MSMLLAFAVLAAVPAIPECRAAQIAVSTDEQDGNFNGMSHSGTLLVLRNRGPACQMAALPALSFLDVRGRPLPIVRNVPLGMHPGLVAVPLTIAAGGLVSTPLRWVSGEVYDRSRCLSPTRLRVAIGGKAITLRFAGRICGPANKPAGIDQPPLNASGV